MDKKIDEITENVTQTDSLKSIATSLMYSLDFTDSSSEKHSSSGMDTYVLDCDSETSESPRSKNNIVKGNTKSLFKNKDIQCSEYSTLHNCSIIAHEIYTQTSKTIIELAKNDGAVLKTVDCNTLETQTSMISITENKTVTYKIEMAGVNKTLLNHDIQNENINITSDQILNQSLEDCSSKPQSVENEAISEKNTEFNYHDTSKTKSEEESEHRSKSSYDSSSDASDIDQDSLMERSNHKTNSYDNSEEDLHTPKSVDREVAELYSKLYEKMEFQPHRHFGENTPDFGQLTPLSEESGTRKNSLIVFEPDNGVNSVENDKDVLFTNTAGIKVKLFPEERTGEVFKLPPIHAPRGSCNSADLNFLFSLNSNKLQERAGALQCLYDEKKDEKADRWELSARELASGEGSFNNGRNNGTIGALILPPIHFANANAQYEIKPTDTPKQDSISSKMQSSITIKDKIKELKMSQKGKNWCHTKFCMLKSDSRSVSPSAESDSIISSPAERGCELICAELLKRLHSASWLDVVVTLEDTPRQLDKFWNVLTEYRIADLLRQVAVHIESPRTQVARTACNTLAVILKNTNYTKKPEFHEAMTILLTKTGSFSRPVRRAANMALDDIVSRVELTHSVTAICIHGVTHKSPLVRCASARLLVVCCALGAGGRELLRARPPTAACARRHVLRALATLLEDRSSETRKYAERLYSMLRPLSSFEAYYISDLDVLLASRQIKKYDQLLLSGLPEPR